MQIKTILNRIEKYQSFVYGDPILLEQDHQLVLEVPIHPRAHSRPVCSGCGHKRPGYDALDPRHFEFIPFWGILVYFLYAMRRVDCPVCGIKVEQVPWAEGKRTITRRYGWFLARWAKRLNWSQVAEAFETTWYTVYTAVETAVEWGRQHVNLEGITAIGIDEMQWGKGHRYVTVVYQINEGCRRLLWIGPDRTIKTTLRFFRWLGKERSSRLEFVCSDMGRSYLKVIAKKAARMVRRHRQLILNWFVAKKAFSSGVVEGLNGKAKGTTRNAYGFRTFKTLEIALYHSLGALPQPEFTHRFF